LCFSNGTHSQRSPTVWAICLGWNHHSFVECSADHLWNNSHSAVSKCINHQLLIRSSDKPLCIDWQCGQGCTTCSHDEHNLCSGCLSTSHGAQYCTQVQAVSPSMPL
jgi:hypothetical protein